MIHEIKLDTQFCDAVLCGEKTFEVRMNDRGYQKGDWVRFIPVGTLFHPVNHPIKDKVYEITYVLSGWGLQDGFCVFAIQEIESEEQQERKTYDGHKVGDEFVGDDGIYRVAEIDGYACGTSVRIMTKEAFIEAYNKFIVNESEDSE